MVSMLFFRRRVDFYQLLHEQSRKVEEGMKALAAYMREPSYINGRSVQRLEEEADDLRANVAKELNDAFVTPIDREDIHALSRAIDDILDYAKATVEEMMSFEVEPNAHLQLMAEGLAEAATAIAQAVGCMAKDQGKATDLVRYAKKRENYVEHCYREAMVELFQRPTMPLPSSKRGKSTAISQAPPGAEDKKRPISSEISSSKPPDSNSVISSNT